MARANFNNNGRFAFTIASRVNTLFQERNLQRADIEEILKPNFSPCRRKGAVNAKAGTQVWSRGKDLPG
jgi:hypothetical protein